MPEVEKFTVEFEVGPDGKITSVIKGITGPACTDIAKVFQGMGKVLADEATPEMFDEAVNKQKVTRRT